ncbi:hypothetical protein SNEBB_004508 [Seison nebaliae]|nr:hypothetical protein SNEBB_004508 [Seison nebaliae]
MSSRNDSIEKKPQTRDKTKLIEDNKIDESLLLSNVPDANVSDAIVPPINANQKGSFIRKQKRASRKQSSHKYHSNNDLHTDPKSLRDDILYYDIQTTKNNLDDSLLIKTDDNTSFMRNDLITNFGNSEGTTEDIHTTKFSSATLDKLIASSSPTTHVTKKKKRKKKSNSNSKNLSKTSFGGALSKNELKPAQSTASSIAKLSKILEEVKKPSPDTSAKRSNIPKSKRTTNSKSVKYEKKSPINEHEKKVKMTTIDGRKPFLFNESEKETDKSMSVGLSSIPRITSLPEIPDDGDERMRYDALNKNVGSDCGRMEFHCLFNDGSCSDGYNLQTIDDQMDLLSSQDTGMTEDACSEGVNISITEPLYRANLYRIPIIGKCEFTQTTESYSENKTSTIGRSSSLIINHVRLSIIKHEQLDEKNKDDLKFQRTSIETTPQLLRAQQYKPIVLRNCSESYVGDYPKKHLWYEQRIDVDTLTAIASVERERVEQLRIPTTCNELQMNMMEKLTNFTDTNFQLRKANIIMERFPDFHHAKEIYKTILNCCRDSSNKYQMNLEEELSFQSIPSTTNCRTSIQEKLLGMNSVNDRQIYRPSISNNHTEENLESCKCAAQECFSVSILSGNSGESKGDGMSAIRSHNSIFKSNCQYLSEVDEPSKLTWLNGKKEVTMKRHSQFQVENLPSINYLENLLEETIPQTGDGTWPKYSKTQIKITEIDTDYHKVNAKCYSTIALNSGKEEIVFPIREAISRFADRRINRTEDKEKKKKVLENIFDFASIGSKATSDGEKVSFSKHVKDIENQMIERRSCGFNYLLKANSRGLIGSDSTENQLIVKELFHVQSVVNNMNGKHTSHYSRSSSRHYSPRSSTRHNNHSYKSIQSRSSRTTNVRTNNKNFLDSVSTATKTVPTYFEGASQGFHERHSDGPVSGSFIPKSFSEKHSNSTGEDNTMSVSEISEEKILKDYYTSGSKDRTDNYSYIYHSQPINNRRHHHKSGDDGRSHKSHHHRLKEEGHRPKHHHRSFDGKNGGRNDDIVQRLHHHRHTSIGDKIPNISLDNTTPHRYQHNSLGHQHHRDKYSDGYYTGSLNDRHSHKSHQSRHSDHQHSHRSRNPDHHHHHHNKTDDKYERDGRHSSRVVPTKRNQNEMLEKYLHKSLHSRSNRRRDEDRYLRKSFDDKHTYKHSYCSDGQSYCRSSEELYSPKYEMWNGRKRSNGSKSRKTCGCFNDGKEHCFVCLPQTRHTRRRNHHSNRYAGSYGDIGGEDGGSLKNRTIICCESPKTNYICNSAVKLSDSDVSSWPISDKKSDLDVMPKLNTIMFDAAIPKDLKANNNIIRSSKITKPVRFQRSRSQRSRSTAKKTKGSKYFKDCRKSRQPTHPHGRKHKYFMEFRQFPEKRISSSMKSDKYIRPTASHGSVRHNGLERMRKDCSNGKPSPKKNKKNIILNTFPFLQRNYKNNHNNSRESSNLRSMFNERKLEKSIKIKLLLPNKHRFLDDQRNISNNRHLEEKKKKFNKLTTAYLAKRQQVEENKQQEERKKMKELEKSKKRKNKLSNILDNLKKPTSTDDNFEEMKFTPKIYDSKLRKLKEKKSEKTKTSKLSSKRMAEVIGNKKSESIKNKKFQLRQFPSRKNGKSQKLKKTNDEEKMNETKSSNVKKNEEIRETPKIIVNDEKPSGKFEMKNIKEEVARWSLDEMVKKLLEKQDSRSTPQRHVVYMPMSFDDLPSETEFNGNKLEFEIDSKNGGNLNFNIWTNNDRREKYKERMELEGHKENDKDDEFWSDKESELANDAVMITMNYLNEAETMIQSNNIELNTQIPENDLRGLDEISLKKPQTLMELIDLLKECMKSAKIAASTISVDKAKMKKKSRNKLEIWERIRDNRITAQLYRDGASIYNDILLNFFDNFSTKQLGEDMSEFALTTFLLEEVNAPSSNQTKEKKWITIEGDDITRDVLGEEKSSGKQMNKEIDENLFNEMNKLKEIELEESSERFPKSRSKSKPSKLKTKSNNLRRITTSKQPTKLTKQSFDILLDDITERIDSTGMLFDGKDNYTQTELIDEMKKNEPKTINVATETDEYLDNNLISIEQISKLRNNSMNEQFKNDKSTVTNEDIEERYLKRYNSDERSNIEMDENKLSHLRLMERQKNSMLQNKLIDLNDEREIEKLLKKKISFCEGELTIDSRNTLSKLFGNFGNGFSDYRTLLTESPTESHANLVRNDETIKIDDLGMISKMKFNGEDLYGNSAEDESESTAKKFSSSMETKKFSLEPSLISNEYLINFTDDGSEFSMEDMKEDDDSSLEGGEFSIATTFEEITSSDEHEKNSEEMESQSDLSIIDHPNQLSMICEEFDEHKRDDSSKEMKKKNLSKYNGVYDEVLKNIIQPENYETDESSQTEFSSTSSSTNDEKDLHYEKSSGNLDDSERKLIKEDSYRNHCQKLIKDNHRRNFQEKKFVHERGKPPDKLTYRKLFSVRKPLGAGNKTKVTRRLNKRAPNNTRKKQMNVKNVKKKIEEFYSKTKLDNLSGTNLIKVKSSKLNRTTNDSPSLKTTISLGRPLSKLNSENSLRTRLISGNSMGMRTMSQNSLGMRRMSQNSLGKGTPSRNSFGKRTISRRGSGTFGKRSEKLDFGGTASKLIPMREFQRLLTKYDYFEKRMKRNETKRKNKFLINSHVTDVGMMLHNFVLFILKVMGCWMSIYLLIILFRIILKKDVVEWLKNHNCHIGLYYISFEGKCFERLFFKLFYSIPIFKYIDFEAPNQFLPSSWNSDDNTEEVENEKELIKTSLKRDNELKNIYKRIRWIYAFGSTITIIFGVSSTVIFVYAIYKYIVQIIKNVSVSYDDIRSILQQEQFVIPLVPGINLPTAHIPYYIISIWVVNIFHETGHAIAAVIEGVRIRGFGVYFFLIFPGAYVVLDKCDVENTTAVQKIRIYSAGIWHNIILTFILFSCVPFLHLIFSALYETRGVYIYDIRNNSPLKHTLIENDQIISLNNCKFSTLNEWKRCLISETDEGFCLDRADVLKFVDRQNRCCDMNEMMDSYLCFLGPNVELSFDRYCLHVRSILKYPRCTSISNCASNKKSNKSLVDCFLPKVETNLDDDRSYEKQIVDLNNERNFNLDNSVYRRLFVIDRAKNNSIIFIGFTFELAKDIFLTEYQSKWKYVNNYIPYYFIFFGQYVIAFSLGLAIVNSIPVGKFDGKIIWQSIITFLPFKEEKQKKLSICLELVYGSLFVINIILGVVLIFI